MPIRAIKAFVPSPDYPWRELPLETNTSTIGDFDDPHLETEFRRFHFRDAGATAFLFAAGVSAGLGMISLSAASDDASSLNVVRRLVITVCCGIGVCIDGFAFFRMSNATPAASWVRLAVLTATAMACALVMGVTPVGKVVSCGDMEQHWPRKPPRGLERGNVSKCRPLLSWHNCTSEHREAAVRWQRHCVDTIDPWLGTTGFVVAALLRLFLRFSIPVLILSATAFSLSYLVRPAPSDTYPYEVRPWDIAADCVIQVVLLVGTVIFTVRFHATHRARFLATARAEQRRLIAGDEMRRLDGLLRRALPSAVLERMTRHGADINDVSEQVSVMSTGIIGLDAWSRGRATQTAAVQALHYLAVTADGIVDRTAASVYRARVSGDNYCVVAGLPEASSCHSSAVCQIALALRNATCGLDIAGTLRQRGDEREVPFSGAALWAAGNLKIRIGVGSGRAFGCVLGVRCLSYDVSGPAVADSIAAVQRGSDGDIIVTAETRRQLLVEASQEVSPELAKPLFATRQSAAEWLHTVTDGDNRFYRLCWVSTTLASPGAEVGRSPLLPATSSAEAAGNAPPFAEGLDPEANHTAAYAHEKIFEQREELEQRMVFVLAHAANTATQREKEEAAPATAFANGSSLTSVEMQPAMDRTSGSTTIQRSDSSQPGSFRRATRFPLLMGFADADEEAGYLAYARTETAAMRRDLRWVTVGLMLTAGVAYAVTADDGHRNKVVIALLALGIFSALVNATALKSRHGEKLDTPLACTTLGLLATAVVVSSTHPNVLGNDGFWLHPTSVLLLQLPTWTLSPLSRAGIGLLFAAAAVYPLMLAEAGDYIARLISAVSLSIAIPMLLGLHESFNRHAYISSRSAEVLDAQRASASDAQQKTLEAVVPRHVVPDLRRWLEDGATTPGSAMAHCAIHDDAAVLMIQLVASARPTLASSPSAGTPAPSLHGHRAIDALIERCVSLVKVRGVGDSVIVAGPLALDAGATPTANQSKEALTDAVLLLAALQDLGVDFVAGASVGVVAGAILGTYRLHYDVRGGTVDHAASMCRLLVAAGGETETSAPPCQIALSADAISTLSGATTEASHDAREFTVCQPPPSVLREPQNAPEAEGDAGEQAGSLSQRKVRVRVSAAGPLLPDPVRGCDAALPVTLQCLTCAHEALC